MKRIRLKVQGKGDRARIKAVEVNSQDQEIPQGGGNITADPKETIRWRNREQDMTNVDFVVRFFDTAQNSWGWPFVETPTAVNNGLLVPRPFGTAVLVTLKPDASPNWKYEVSLVPDVGIDPLDPMIIIRGRKQFRAIAFAVIAGACIGALATYAWLVLRSGPGIAG